MSSPVAFLLFVVAWVGCSVTLGVAGAWLLRRASGRRSAWWALPLFIVFWLVMGPLALKVLRGLI